MQKYLLLLLFTFLFLTKLSAQDNGKPDFKRFGFRAGINISNMNFNKGVPAPAVPVSASWKAGIFFGFLLQVPLTTSLSIEPEYLFSQMNGGDKSENTTYRLNYLSMPVFLKYAFNSRVAVLAGPQLDLLLNAKKDSSGNSYNITHDTEERNFGLAAGLAFRLYKDLEINARYMQGLNHVGIGQRSDVKEFKFEGVQFSACIRF